MATFFLVNNCRVGTQYYFAGSVVDDQHVVTATMQQQGAVLWPTSDPLMARAAQRAQEARLGGNDGEPFMMSAVAQQVLNILSGLQTGPSAAPGSGFGT